MATVRFVVAVLFQFMAVALVAQFLRVKRFGLLLGAAAYFGGGVLAIATHSWWPLAGGFALVLLLSRLGTELPLDVRDDLPRIDRLDVGNDATINAHLEHWLSVDEQVGLVRSQIIREAWARGFRGPSSLQEYLPADASTAEEAWRRTTLTDLRQLATSSRQAFRTHLDQLMDVTTSTLAEVGDRAERYGLPAEVRDLDHVLASIGAPAEQRAFLDNYVADSIVSARLRVLGWLFQLWHGERYEPTS